MKPNKISLSQQLKVAYEAGKGDTYRQIGENLGISKSSVGRILQIMRNEQLFEGRIDLINPFRYHFVAMNLFSNPLITYR